MRTEHVAVGTFEEDRNLCPVGRYAVPGLSPLVDALSYRQPDGNTNRDGESDVFRKDPDHKPDRGSDENGGGKDSPPQTASLDPIFVRCVSHGSDPFECCRGRLFRFPTLSTRGLCH